MRLVTTNHGHNIFNLKCKIKLFVNILHFTFLNLLIIIDNIVIAFKLILNYKFEILVIWLDIFS